MIGIGKISLPASPRYGKFGPGNPSALLIIKSANRSKFSTWTEQAKTFVPVPSGGRLPGFIFKN
jgi:hypothetical protein